jgi:hypothetical protein
MSWRALIGVLLLYSVLAGLVAAGAFLIADRFEDLEARVAGLEGRP